MEPFLFRPILDPLMLYERTWVLFLYFWWFPVNCCAALRWDTAFGGSLFGNYCPLLDLLVKLRYSGLLLRMLYEFKPWLTPLPIPVTSVLRGGWRIDRLIPLYDYPTAFPRITAIGVWAGPIASSRYRLLLLPLVASVTWSFKPPLRALEYLISSSSSDWVLNGR